MPLSMAKTGDIIVIKKITGKAKIVGVADRWARQRG